MKNQFLWLALTSGVLSMVAGCSSTNGLHTGYVSPRVEGRVIDAQTKAPIERVIVVRQHRSDNVSMDAGMDDYISAGEIQQANAAVYTNDEGAFELPALDDLELGGDKTWIRVTLKFMHPNYHMFSTNYVHHPDGAEPGVPVLQAGDIELQPVPMPAGAGK